MGNHFLIFVPGILGSELRYIGEGAVKQRVDVAVWGENLAVMWQALAENPKRLQGTLTPGEVLRSIAVLRRKLWFDIKIEVYERLLNFLQELGYKEGHNFRGFAYDWRKDNRETASLLAGFMREKVKSGVEQFKIIAHSMGGLVVRLLLADPANQELASRIMLFVQIGTPVKGSSKAYYTLKRSPQIHPILDKLMELEAHWRPELLVSLRESLRSFHSIFQLLPPDTEQILVNQNGDHFSALDPRGWASQDEPQLDRARQIHPTIEVCHLPHMKTFYSTDILTDWDFVVDQYFNLVRKRQSCVLGDGTVSCKSATDATPLDSRAPIRGSNAQHDRLPNHPEVLEYLRQELPN